MLAECFSVELKEGNKTKKEHTSSYGFTDHAVSHVAFVYHRAEIDVKKRKSRRYHKENEKKNQLTRDKKKFSDIEWKGKIVAAASSTRICNVC